MRKNPHAVAAIAYLNELCSMLQNQRRIRRPRRDWWNPPVLCSAAVGLAVGSLACGGTVLSSDNNLSQPEVCDDGIDNDLDGKTDCKDPDCPSCSTAVYAAPSDAGFQEANNPIPEASADTIVPPKDSSPIDSHVAENCTDGVDNDGDKLIDCADPDCSCKCEPKENCTNKVDDDCDGLADCQDPDCASDQCCQPPSPAAYSAPWTEDCLNGKDDDCDGFVDCEDPDCAISGCCPTPPPYMAPAEVCCNGKDDDCDGKVDCYDADCVAAECCAQIGYAGPYEFCHNGKDDDGDGSVDCEDSDCAANACCSWADYAAPTPPPENCQNPDDEDCDGLINCDDPDCKDLCVGLDYAAPSE